MNNEMPNIKTPEEKTPPDSSNEESKHEKFVSSSVSKAEMNKQIEEGEQKEAEEKERQLDKGVETEVETIKDKIIEDLGWRDLSLKGVDNTIHKTIKESLPESLEQILKSYRIHMINAFDKNDPEKSLKLSEKFCEELEFYGETAAYKNKSLGHSNIVQTLRFFSKDADKKGFTKIAEQAMLYAGKLEKSWAKIRAEIF